MSTAITYPQSSDAANRANKPLCHSNHIYSDLRLYTTQQLVIGADTPCPILCTDLSTPGPGEQLFSASRESQTCPFWATAKVG
jgi:hypothetical protein